MIERTPEQCKEFRVRLREEMVKRHVKGDVPCTGQYRFEEDSFCALGLTFNQMVEEEPEKFYWDRDMPKYKGAEFLLPLDRSRRAFEEIGNYLGISVEGMDILVSVNDKEMGRDHGWLDIAQAILDLDYTQEETTCP